MERDTQWVEGVGGDDEEEKRKRKRDKECAAAIGGEVSGK